MVAIITIISLVVVLSALFLWLFFKKFPDEFEVVLILLVMLICEVITLLKLFLLDGK